MEEDLGNSHNPELEILKLQPVDEDLLAEEDEEVSSESDLEESTENEKMA